MIYQWIGLFLLGIGFSHKLISNKNLDYQVAKFIQIKFSRPPILDGFMEIWFLGRTPFTLITLLLLTGFNWKLGLSALVVFGIVVGLEMVIKKTLKRDRPYLAHDDLDMLQPWEPSDPSFPSGDALRIWFLVLVLSIAMGNNLLLGILSALLAGLVSFGRIIFGVHYLSDVLAGIGLGFLGAGTTIWVWQAFNLL